MSSFYSDFPLCDSSYLGLIWFHADERLEWGSIVGFVCERDKEMTLNCLHRKCKNTKLFHTCSDSQGHTPNKGCHMWACITWLKKCFKLSRYLLSACTSAPPRLGPPTSHACLVFRIKQYISIQSIQLQTIAFLLSFPRSHRLSLSASFSFSSLVLSHLIHSKSIFLSFPPLFSVSLCSCFSLSMTHNYSDWLCIWMTWTQGTLPLNTNNIDLIT